MINPLKTEWIILKYLSVEQLNYLLKYLFYNDKYRVIQA